MFHPNRFLESKFPGFVEVLYFLKVADLFPKHLRKQAATYGTKKDLNIGFPGLIQGKKIYNPGNLYIEGDPQKILR